MTDTKRRTQLEPDSSGCDFKNEIRNKYNNIVNMHTWYHWEVSSIELMRQWLFIAKICWKFLTISEQSIASPKAIKISFRQIVSIFGVKPEEFYIK